MLDQRSMDTLAPLCPAFTAKVVAADAVIAPQGIRMCVYSGLRDAVEQNKLYASGKTVPGPWKTNAKAGQSMHNYGLAADIVPYISNSVQLDWNVESPTYKAMVAALKAQGLEWGGDWVDEKDMDHFQMPGFPPTPTEEMQTAYAKGEPIESVWPDHANEGTVNA